MLKITIAIDVCDTQKDSYKDPCGRESVDLFCIERDLQSLLNPVDSIASALLKVANLKYLAAVEKERSQE